MQHAMSVAYAIFLPSALARPVEQRKIGIVVGYEALTPAVGGIQPTLEQAPCPHTFRCYHDLHEKIDVDGMIKISLHNEITPLPTKIHYLPTSSLFAQTPPFFAQTPPFFAQPSTFARPPAAPWI